MNLIKIEDTRQQKATEEFGPQASFGRNDYIVQLVSGMLHT